MSIRIDDIAPDFTVDSTAGKINLHDWIGDSYAILKILHRYVLPNSAQLLNLFLNLPNAIPRSWAYLSTTLKST